MRACTSSNSRTFSIAITAWSAKVVTSSICLSVNGSTLVRVKNEDADRGSLAQQRDAERRAIVAKRQDAAHIVFRIGLDVVHMDDSSSSKARPTIVPRPGAIATLSKYSLFFNASWYLLVTP